MPAGCAGGACWCSKLHARHMYACTLCAAHMATAHTAPHAAPDSSSSGCGAWLTASSVYNSSWKKGRQLQAEGPQQGTQQATQQAQQADWNTEAAMHARRWLVLPSSAQAADIRAEALLRHTGINAIWLLLRPTSSPQAGKQAARAPVGW